MTAPKRPSDLSNFIIYCDGACSGNPGPGGWGSIVATSSGEVWELGGGQLETTNNQMELTAAISSLKSLPLRGARTLSATETKGERDPSLIERQAMVTVSIYTDSVYVIRGITQWIWGWKNRGWKTAEGKDIANQDLWQTLLRVVLSLKDSYSLEWKYVRGHTGNPGNERCDEIAVAFSKNRFVPLYRGKLLTYDVSIWDLPEDLGLPEMKSRSESPTKVLFYLSMVGGILMKHSTWPDCERRVKGQSGAKFKKITTPEEEEKVLKEWKK